MVSVLESEIPQAVPGVSVADGPEGLSVLQSPDCAAAIWDRSPLPGFRSWIDALDPDRLPRARVILRPNNVQSIATQICEACGTPDCPERRMLTGNTAALAEIFADLMRAPFLRLRYDAIDTNACRKFHIDAVTARLVCTYRGPGTQYGAPNGAAEPSPVFAVEAGAPLLLRGTKWPAKQGCELLHRSPPIEGTGVTRLVLVLDPIDDPESHPDQVVLH